MAGREIVIAMDLYGSLLSPDTVAQELELYYEKPKAYKISTTWRQRQLEYTWKLNSMGRFMPFPDVTKNALLQALAEAGSDMGSADLPNLMNMYDSMEAWEDVNDGFRQLAGVPNFKVVIISNGTHAMVSKGILRSKDLAVHADSIKEIICADEVQQFKPSPAIYKRLAERVGKTDAMKDVWMVSSDTFDITGALCMGMSAIFLDRRNTGWIDKTIPEIEPTGVLSSLSQVADFISSHYKIYGGI
ncbi:putative haloacid dehalogenase-like hydrolase [Aspergillus clavatus NRRL 1]|uniref:Haloacid dehalogenase-like hydrolase, putative n=1 Tax=Aspergillus clavatus (strain ATCC 1007 / CBS 513.65 / DSM 816 / NCTC 3887 / NRRL 1 / QM 1276 / 107) TaxID=344612 RepID=A1CR11_ASPCL|nr:haloacid dehalogenase-like hydrolase, putative [Aspergillus clavatus NRRL 1]EAW08082.1 haloacid dehalogenase-like hydrolase, putative [Aspergillus clavatus NRRL 1]